MRYFFYVAQTVLGVFLLLLTACADPNGAHKPIEAETSQQPQSDRELDQDSQKNPDESSSTPQNFEPVRFDEVQPIFKARCTPCHNWHTQFQSIQALAERGRDSKLYRYVILKDPIEMPLRGTPQSLAITQEERAIIGQWALDGALPAQPSAEQ